MPKWALQHCLCSRGRARRVPTCPLHPGPACHCPARPCSCRIPARALRVCWGSAPRPRAPNRGKLQAGGGAAAERAAGKGADFGREGPGPPGPHLHLPFGDQGVHLVSHGVAPREARQAAAAALKTLQDEPPATSSLLGPAARRAPTHFRRAVMTPRASAACGSRALFFFKLAASHWSGQEEAWPEDAHARSRARTHARMCSALSRAKLAC